jgi:hypothetical protein
MKFSFDRFVPVMMPLYQCSVLKPWSRDLDPDQKGESETANKYESDWQTTLR